LRDLHGIPDAFLIGRGDQVKTKKFGTLVLAGAMFASIAGCSGQPLTTREKGTLLGGAVGAGGGALVGAAVGAPGAGAAIGGAGGAVAGYAIGNHMQNQENSDYYYRH
jgi:osmotically inducible lipoprotein OsmB